MTFLPIMSNPSLREGHARLAAAPGALVLVLSPSEDTREHQCRQHPLVPPAVSAVSSGQALHYSCAVRPVDDPPWQPQSLQPSELLVSPLCSQLLWAAAKFT